MNIAVVGGGVTGLTIAQSLSRRGHRTVVFEQGALGGLAGGFPYPGCPGVYLDKFYHHIFTSDTAILELIDEHGLADDLRWYPSRSGLIAQGRTWPFGSALDLLRFAPLGTLRQRLLMGWNLRYFARTENWRPLDRIRCREFFARRRNLDGYRNLWEPLLKQKFADAHDDVPASFLWGRIHPRARSRSKRRESLGYLDGGFHRLFPRMAETIGNHGGEVRTGQRVRRLRPGNQPRISCDGAAESFDRVVWTAGPRRLLDVLENPPADFADKALAIEYLAVTQLILIVKRRMTDYYWLNNLDPDVTFGGLIEHTNMVPPEKYGGEHIVYVVNYHRPGDPRFAGKSAEEILDHHAASLARVIPGFRREEILRTYCIRDAFSSPLYDLGFADRRPPYQGWLPNVDICGMSQVYPEDRNMNHCVVNATKWCTRFAAAESID